MAAKWHSLDQSDLSITVWLLDLHVRNYDLNLNFNSVLMDDTDRDSGRCHVIFLPIPHSEPVLYGILDTDNELD
jgi:hypothetical protein